MECACYFRAGTFLAPDRLTRLGQQDLASFFHA